MSDLLNLIGMSTGIALYAMLLVMVVRAGPASTRSGQVDPLLLATALLGLVWNVCALPAYELPKLGVFDVLPVFTAVGFCALGFLPAVTVHSVLRSESAERGRLTRRVIVIVAYGVGATAAVLQGRASWIGDPLPSVSALQLLTYAFVLLVFPLAALTRRQPSSRRALWVAALSIFAVSAMHLSQFERGDQSWPVELVGHHASLPLAFAILYQDFPFALADLFLKRALTLLALFTTAFVSVATFGVATSTGNGHLRGARDVGVLVALWVATALLYPRLRNLSAWFVDAIVLKRPDYALLRSHIAAAVQAKDDITEILDGTCTDLRPALSARMVSWCEWPSAPGGEWASKATAVSPTRPIAAVVEIPVSEPPRYALIVEGLTGGRRLLSDDHTALDAIATVLARRIDAIRITRERYDRELREQEIGKLATEAELRALRSQINPHFLFNALTTIGHLIQTAPPRALDTLMRLTSLLRAVLRSDGELTTLGRELALIEAYLDIEHARFEHRLQVRIDVPAELRDIQIPPLLLQPLVENAVKHGIAPERRGGEVSVEARLANAGRENATLTVTVRDSGAGASHEELRHGRELGVGLKNIERRLECQYGALAALTVHSAPGVGTTVEIQMPAHLTPAEGVATVSQ